MELLFEGMSPATLTKFARLLAARIETNTKSLATLLPSRQIDGLKTRQTKVSRTTVQAKYRAFDAVTPIGKRPIASTVSELELPPLGQKLPIREKEIIQQAIKGAEWAQVIQTIYDDTENNVAAILNSAEYRRAQFLFTGAVTIAENGFIQEADFGLDPTHNLDAADIGTLWSDPSAPIFDQERELMAIVEDDSQENVVATVASRRIIQAMLGNDAFKIALGPRPTITNLNAIRAEYGLPPLFQYDTKLGGVRITPDNRIAMVTATVGETQWGLTAEELELVGSNAVDDVRRVAPRITASAWKTTDPVGIWSKANATMMPVAGDINGLLVAEVLGVSSES